MKNYSILFFLSDEGFGHIVRQEAIINEFINRNSLIKITAITKKKIDVIKEKFGTKINYIEKYNNLHTVKTSSGSLNIEGTKLIFNKYIESSNKWLKSMPKLIPEFDFAISDCVPEAIELCYRLNKPCFNISHFTWDWFYYSIIKKDNKTVKVLENYLNKASLLFFPPFTPVALLRKYGVKVKEVPFIINEFVPITIKHKGDSSELTALIMDNGTNTLRHLIENGIRELESINNVQFFVSVENFKKKTTNYIENSKNINPVYGLREMHSHIPQVDFVIARGGFNTLTECLITKTPALLIKEGKNPEVSSNIEMLEKNGFAACISVNGFKGSLKNRIISFLISEFEIIKRNLNEAGFKNNGPSQICADIINYMEKN